MRGQIQSFSLALSLAASLLSTEVQAQTLLWSEEFNTDGPPDPGTWSYDVGHNNGWGNGELQTYTTNAENVVVDNGSLKITVIRESNEFTSGRIKTDNKFSFTYGTLVARIKVPDLDAGLWAAFWTMGSDFYQVGWPKSGEIDIMEMGQGLAIQEGVVNRRVVSAAHWDIFGQYATYAKSLDVAENLTQDFHEYKLEWTPTKMITYVDDQWIWEIDIGDECPSCAELHQPHHILLNMAVGGGFTSGGTSSSAAGSSSSSCGSSSAGTTSAGGCPSRTPDEITAPLPGELLVDWIRLYDIDGMTQIYTPAPTPAPTLVERQPETPEPTPRPTTPMPSKRPTPGPTPFPTPSPTQPPIAPTTPIPATTNTPAPITTNAPVFPVTQSPVQRQPTSRSYSGKAGKGKAGYGGSSSRSGVRQPGYSGKGKGKGGKSGYSGTRQGASYGKGKGKGKGKGYRQYDDDNRANPGGSSVPYTPGTPSAAPTITPVSNRQTPLPTPYSGTDADQFGPEDSSDTRPGVQSLVAQPGSAASSARYTFYLSMLLPGLVAVGMITGVGLQW